jgi:hypothetical protein
MALLVAARSAFGYVAIDRAILASSPEDQMDRALEAQA